MAENNSNNKELTAFLKGRPEHSLQLFHHFIAQYQKIGELKVEATKSMIGISNSKKRIAWVTQVGKNFVHVVFPFKKQYRDNLCFQKIAQVPGDAKQYNHHFRMYHKEDVNEEVMKFMEMAFVGE